MNAMSKNYLEKRESSESFLESLTRKTE